MKFFTKISAVALVVMAAACTPKSEYNLVPFVSFTSGTSATYEENAGEISLPVAVYNTQGSVTVAVTATDGKAKQGVDYEIVGGSVLTVEPGKPADLKIKIIPHPDEVIGNLDFTVSIAPSGEGVEAGIARSCKITILELDVVYDWAWLAGTWKAQDYNANSGAKAGSAYSLKIQKVDETHCTITGLWGEDYTLEAEVDFSTKMLSIKRGKIYEEDGIVYDFFGFSGGYLYNNTLADLDPSGIHVRPYYVYNLDEGGYGPYITDCSR